MFYLPCDKQRRQWTPFFQILLVFDNVGYKILFIEKETLLWFTLFSTVSMTKTSVDQQNTKIMALQWRKLSRKYFDILHEWRNVRMCRFGIVIDLWNEMQIDSKRISDRGKVHLMIVNECRVKNTKYDRIIVTGKSVWNNRKKKCRWNVWKIT